MRIKIHLIPYAVVSLLVLHQGGWAQEPPAEAADESAPVEEPADTAAATAALEEAPAEFYQPPVIRDVWREAFGLVDTLDEAFFTRRFVRNLLDSLAALVQGSFDTLAARARVLEETEPGYTHKFFRSPLTRGQILGEPITETEAARTPHFHAVYDYRGYLLRIRYVEPRTWRAQQEALARREFQPQADGGPPLVRYFRKWDVRLMDGRHYVKKNKLVGGQPHYRVLYDGEDNIQAVQHYDSGGDLVFTVTFNLAAMAGEPYARLSFTGKSAGSLLVIDPYLFYRDWSVVQPGWQVAFTLSPEGTIASAQVFNLLDQLVYYYTFEALETDAGDTTTTRVSVLTPEGTIEKVYTLSYDRGERLVRRAFYTTAGQLLETISYEYLPKTSEMIVTTRNAIGNITARHNYLYAPLKD